MVAQLLAINLMCKRFALLRAYLQVYPPSMGRLTPVV